MYGQKLTEARISRGWDIDELARRTRLPHGYLRQIEGGRVPDLRSITKINTALGIDIMNPSEPAPQTPSILDSPFRKMVEDPKLLIGNDQVFV